MSEILVAALFSFGHDVQKWKEKYIDGINERY